MRPLSRLAVLAATSLVLGPAGAARAAEIWQVTGGAATLSLPEGRLATLGLSVAGARPTAATAPELAYSFDTASDLDVAFRVEGGAFRGFASAPASIPFRGGLVLQAVDPRDGSPRAPAVLFDFLLEVGAERAPDFARIRAPGADGPSFLKVRSAGIYFEPEARELVVSKSDLVISAEWARALGVPDLAGQGIGALDLRLAAVPAGTVPGRTLGLAPPKGPREPVLDVVLGELYDLGSWGRLGAYPDGWSGLAAATTSCNNGGVNVPWFAPMDPAHPGIGLALFREKDGVLEMLGKNWLKHGWFAVTSNQCDYGCTGTGGGSWLVVGCSDTYSAFNNASHYYLGPREEFNPHTGDWEPWGSFFDGSPVDGLRDYIGDEPNDVVHTLEVHDSDLGDPDAAYYYEGCYYVAGDDSLHNNIGWRECTTSWNGSAWSFATVGMPELAPNQGPVVLNWGDVHDTKTVAPDDGLVLLAAKFTDEGGGLWHYEYALYNRSSDRAVYSFSVPVGDAVVSNPGFRDIDRDPASDWTATVGDGAVTWSTDDYDTDPAAPALTYQTLYNFRFDADRAPVSASATAGIFKPGAGTSFFLDTRAPAAAIAREASADPGAGLVLSHVGANPFSRATGVRFSLPRPGPARVSVLDVAGRTVQVLVDGTAPAGPTVIRWDGRDSTGRRVANGVYFFRLESDHGARVTKGTLLR